MDSKFFKYLLFYHLPLSIIASSMLSANDFMRYFKFFFLLMLSFMLCQCAGTISTGSMGGPTMDERAAEIDREPKGEFYYGRRYFVEKTRFWGYLRKPRQSSRHAKLVVFRESSKLNPDRLPEDGPEGQRYGFDHNYEYRIWGRYTGRNVYDVNSNQFLPEFLLVNYDLVNRNPGWLFRPNDSYDPTRITLIPR
jgi:hypothetical protein